MTRHNAFGIRPSAARLRLQNRFTPALTIAWIVVACAVLFPAVAGAQAIRVGLVSGMPGAPVDLSIGFTAGSQGMATLQFDLSLPNALTPVSTSTGAAVAAAGKSANGSSFSGGIRILIFGLNQNAIDSGVLAVVRLNIAGGTPASSLAVTIGNIIASDALGDAVAVSGSDGMVVVTSTSDTTPPIISQVSTSQVGQTSSHVTWTTNEAANSQVEYGIANSYGSTTALDEYLTTGHVQTLAGLTPRTLYHYRVKSSDGTGNLSVSADSTFTTAGPTSMMLFYPRMLTTDVEAGSTDQEFTGLGIANLNSQTATLTFTAYNSNGVLLSGPGITNPATRQLESGRQLPPIMDHELFGTGVRGTDATGWAKIESDVPSVTGFFLMFNGKLSELDGADMYGAPLSAFVFPEINSDGFNKINIGNPNDAAATLTFSLFASPGYMRSTQTRTIPANGALVADLYEDIFRGVTADATDYVKVSSTEPVLPYMVMGRFGEADAGAQDLQSLHGQDAAAGSMKLYSPQYIIGDIWRSTLSLVNLDMAAGDVSISFIGMSGQQIGATRVVQIESLGKFRLDDSRFFEPTLPADGREGYLVITSSNIRLTGSVVFGDPQRRTHSTALPLVNTLDRSIVFSHVSSNDTYYTGVAIVNPNWSDAHVTVQLYGGDGSLGVSSQVTIPANQRISKVLTELFPDLAGVQRYSGYFQVTSDVGVASFAVFGSRDLKLLSAIPPQPVR